MNSEKIKKSLENLPASSGIYRMRDSGGKIVYVGKAANLKKRVSSYFQKKKHPDYKTSLLVTEIHSIDFIETETETEALILESSLIKQFMPKYNIMLKDDKSYPLVKVVFGDGIPGIKVVREKQKDSNIYYGPYTDVKLLNKAISFLKANFRIKRCAYREPDEKQFRHCLYYKMGECDAPCVGKISPEQYIERIKYICLVLGGKRARLVSSMNSKMKNLSVSQKYEEAAYLRDCIKALNSLFGKKRKNRDMMFSGDVNRSGLEELARILKIKKSISIIEAFDVSNIFGSQAVGSMVRFADGLPDKKNYRKFSVKEIKQADDCAMISEIVKRRYKRVLDEGKQLPNLILVDGGRGQVSSAVKSLSSIGIAEVPVVGLAKKHEELYLPHLAFPVRMNRDSGAVRLLQRIRDEAHRFAISFHRKKRSSTMFASFLDRINGIGPVRRRKLLAKFGSIPQILKADELEISKFAGVSIEFAGKVKGQLKKLKGKTKKRLEET